MSKANFTVVLFFLVMAAVAAQDEPVVYKVTEEMPTVEECKEMTDWQARHQCTQEKIARHLDEKLKYPKEALKAGFEGVAVVTFVVEDDGDTDDFQILEDPGHGLGDAALKAIKRMKYKWVPGRNKGEAVNTLMRVPVAFTLPEEEPEEVPPPPAPDVYTMVDEMPRYAGCAEVATEEVQTCNYQKIMRYMLDSLQYPAEAKEAGTEGPVIVKFVIDEKGSVTSPEVVESLGQGCDEEALRLVRGMPQWTPGKHNGEVVKVELTLPFQFRLRGK